MILICEKKYNVKFILENIDISDRFNIRKKIY